MTQDTLAASPSKGAGQARPFPSIWAFIAIDCIGFSIFFAVFMSERLKQAELFSISARTLDARLGLLNTLILISSGWLVALAAAAAQRGDVRKVVRRLIAAIAIGSGFAVFKIVEYSSKIAHGTTPLSNDFFGYYFALTGVHFLHYVIGMGVLIVTVRKWMRADESAESRLTWIESGGIYWHMVDLLWVFLFPMLYLLGGAQ